MKIIVTGGAGFISSCFVRLTLQNPSLEKGRDGEIYKIRGNRSLPNKTVVALRRKAQPRDGVEAPVPRQELRQSQSRARGNLKEAIPSATQIGRRYSQ